MQQWEYLDLPFVARSKWDHGPRMLNLDVPWVDDKGRKQWTRPLSYYGDQGWELVSCTQYHATFKRPKLVGDLKQIADNVARMKV